MTNAEGVDEVVETFVRHCRCRGRPRHPACRLGHQRSCVWLPVRARSTVSMSCRANRFRLTSCRRSGRWRRPGDPRRSGPRGAAKVNSSIEGPVMRQHRRVPHRCLQGRHRQAATAYVGPRCRRTTWPERQDIFVVNDSAPPRLPNQTSAAYKTSTPEPLSGPTRVTATRPPTGRGSWCPTRIRLGDDRPIPPGGAVMGVTARIDATVGVFRAPGRGHRRHLQRSRRADQVHRHRVGRPQQPEHQHHPLRGRCWHLRDGRSYPQDLRRRPLRQRTAHA